METSRELEKKWLLTQLPKLPENDFEILSVQTFNQFYISPTERVRIITDHGIKGSINNHMEYFTKTIPDGDGASIEKKSVITETEFLELSKEFKKKVEKVRTTWEQVSTGLLYEFDYIKLGGLNNDSLNHSTLIVLEIEFQDQYKNIEEVNDNFILPKFLEQYVLLDATGLKQFSNYNLANKIK